ncbi:MAG: SEC-C domain-containing protein [Blastocatellia bacterium]|nr:SEC-C domain-containing protein [Blastocatellia bacterium]
MKTGRNSLCTCGSGLKYKFCCGPKAGRTGNKTQLLLIAGVVLLGGFILFTQVFSSNDASPSGTLPAPAPAGAPITPAPQSSQNAPQPPGPAPAGKVWSPEHGHWHDAQPNQQAGQPAVQANQGQNQTPQPQPPGPAPAGKVWSPEHGHWHDAPNN